MAPRRTRASAAAEAAVDIPQQLSSPPATPAAPVTAKRQPRKKAQTASPDVKVEANDEASNQLPASTRKRARAPAKSSNKASAVLDELPHGLGPLPSPDTDDIKDEAGDAPPPKKRARTSKAKKFKADPEEMKQLAGKAAQIASPDAQIDEKPKKAAKKKGYGLTPGQTPFPEWQHPTPEECQEVERLLSEVHGKVKAPKTIPLPSLTVTGCGEVPSVLDALIRTRLSAATTSLNSSRAFQGLVKTFGTIQEGIGKGSVDWNAVRLASQKEVFESIRQGGLADVKSKDIKKILDMVYEENQVRSTALKEESRASSSFSALPTGAENEAPQEKQAEISRAESNVLSLDHLHLMSDNEALNEMTKYPGIGPKTASCVLLFCLQRPSFAVDTHVFRLCKWLGWVPPVGETKKGQPKVDRNTTYSHCEVRIPNEQKYALHQLLIKHGKTCGRCDAKTGPNSERWAEGCPIDHLVKRDGLRKGTHDKATKKSGKKAAKSKGKDVDSESEAEAESSALSEVEGEEEEVEVMKKTTRKKSTPRKAAAKPKSMKVDSESDAESSAPSEPESEDEYTD